MHKLVHNPYLSLLKFWSGMTTIRKHSFKYSFKSPVDGLLGRIPGTSQPGATSVLKMTEQSVRAAEALDLGRRVRRVPGLSTGIRSRGSRSSGT